MSKPTRESCPPPGAFQKLRNMRLYGGRDAQIEGTAERARGCPNPDNAIVYTRKRPKLSSIDNYERNPPTAQTPRAHKRHVEKLYREMLDAQRDVKRARESGCEEDRLAYAAIARDARRAYLNISGTEPEAKYIEVDQGSETSPVRAV